jgi:hypothetical protein
VKLPRYVNWSTLIDAATNRNPKKDAALQEEPDPARVGWLHVVSWPAAEVFVDGKVINRVSSEGKIALPPGSYEISLRHPRRPRRPTFQVTIQQGATLTLRRRL